MSVWPESTGVRRSLVESGGLWQIVRRTLPDSGQTMWGSEKYCYDPQWINAKYAEVHVHRAHGRTNSNN